VIGIVLIILEGGFINAIVKLMMKPVWLCFLRLLKGLIGVLWVLIRVWPDLKLISLVEPLLFCKTAIFSKSLSVLARRSIFPFLLHRKFSKCLSVILVAISVIDVSFVRD